MRKKEMMRMLDERAERIAALERRMEKNENVIESYRAREQAIVDSLAAAQNESRQRLAAAQEKADGLIGEARRTAESATQAAEISASEIVAKAEAYRNTLVADANAQADAILAAAREKSSEVLAQTQAAVAAYEEALTRYNSLIEESAAAAREKAQQYAAFLNTRTLAVPELTRTAENLSDAPYIAPVELPDVENNPAQLMRNIYTLEKREIPEDAAEQPAYPTPAVDAAETATEVAVEEVIAVAPAPEEKPEPAHDEPSEPEPVEAPEAEEPDLAPRPEPEETMAVETAEETVFVETPAPEEGAEEPDLAPRPETSEWRPEDEAPVREWQPEEMDMPTVGELTGDRPVDDEVEMSLDALLDEIIRSGE